MLVTPAVGLAKTKHNAVLIHIGPSGLEAFDAWTHKTKTVVAGLKGNDYAPIYSPHRLSVASIVSGRTDRAGVQDLYVACLANAKAIEVGDPANDVQIMSFEGWLDDYTAVYDMEDGQSDSGRYSIDTRTGARTAVDDSVVVPAWPEPRPNTAGDSKYLITSTTKQVMTVRVRKGKKKVAKFKIPGSGNGKSATAWYVFDWSVSQDGAFISYELERSPHNNDSFEWRTYVCTIRGKGARSIKNGNGGFLWY